MTDRLKESVHVASEGVRDQFDSLRDQAQDLLRDSRIPSGDELKESVGQSLEKTAQKFDALNPSYKEGLCKQIKAHPFRSVLISLVSGFFLGRLSK